MAFKSKQVSGNGTTTVDVITNLATVEAVVFGLTAYNSGTVDDTLKLLINGTTVYTATVPAGTVYTYTSKLSIGASEVFSIQASTSTSINIAYLEGAIDALTVSTEVQTVLDMKPSIDAVYADLANIDATVTALPVIREAKTNALTAQSAANYKGDWSSTYTGGYAVGDSVTYVDGRRYVSKVNNNVEEPTLGVQWEKVSITSWNYRDENTNCTAQSFDFIFVDTSTNTVTVTLPASPTNNDMVSIKDIKGTFSTNNVIVAGNGNSIMGLNENMTGSTDNMKFTLVFKNNDWRLL